MKSKRQTSRKRTSRKRTSPRRTSPRRRASPRRNRKSNSRSRRGKNRRKRASSKNKNKYDGSVEQIPMTSRCYLIVENKSPHNFRAIDIYHGIFIRIDDDGDWIFKIVKKYQGPRYVTEGATKSFNKNDCIFIYDGQYTLESYSEQEYEDLGLETADNDAINEFFSAYATDPNVVIIGQHMNPY